MNEIQERHLNATIKRKLKALSSMKKYSHKYDYIMVNQIRLEQEIDDLIDEYVDAGGKCFEN